MATYVVSYDLTRPGQNYPGLTKYLDSLNGGRIQQSVWVVSTSLTASQLHDAVNQHLDKTDKLFVLKSGREAAWTGLTPAWDKWLQDNL